MTTVHLLYRLRPGVEPERYERWVLEADAPFVRERPTVIRYEVHRLGRVVEGHDEAPYDYIEILEVDDLEQDQALIEGPRGRELDAEWRRLTTGATIVITEPVTRYRRQEP